MVRDAPGGHRPPGPSALVQGLAATAVAVALGFGAFAASALVGGERIAVHCTDEGSCQLRRGGLTGGLHAVGTFPLASVQRLTLSCDDRSDSEGGTTSRCGRGMWVVGWNDGSGPATTEAVWVAFTTNDTPVWRRHGPGEALLVAQGTGEPLAIEVDSLGSLSWLGGPGLLAMVAASVATIAAITAAGCRRWQRRRASEPAR